MNGSLQFLVLKKLNRLAHIRCKKVRDETNEVNMDLKLNSTIQHKVKSNLEFAADFVTFIKRANR